MDSKRGTVGGQWKASRQAKSDVRYWRQRVQKRKFRGPDGTPMQAPEWSLRMRRAGREVWFNLETANREAAAEVAQQIAEHAKEHGLDSAIARFKRKEKSLDETTVEEFCNLFREAAAGFKQPIRRSSVEHYCTNLAFIANKVGVGRIADLSRDKLIRFRSEYAGEVSRGSVAARFRIGSAMFSKQALTYYTARGLDLPNPFAGLAFNVPTSGYEPLARSVIDKIWEDATTLKKDNPAAYAILLLELGLGLRRNESDKAERSWLFVSNGRRFLKIQKTRFFEPKNGRERVLPVADDLFIALQSVMPEVGPFIVPGPLPPEDSTSKAVLYRCDDAHRALVTWLRERGVEGNRPCHRLRKEFGSVVASTFGLFYAQKFLGHQSPVLTSALYAGTIDLPALNHAKV